jgi:hypothetical protein
MWSAVISENHILRVSDLGDVALAQSPLQLRRETHPAARTLQTAVRRIGQNVTALWAIKSHGNCSLTRGTHPTRCVPLVVGRQPTFHLDSRISMDAINPPSS